MKMSQNSPKSHTPEDWSTSLSQNAVAQRLVGYARVSTDEQDVRTQVEALRAAGCGEIFADDGISGATNSRPALDSCLATLQPGDTLVVVSLSRFGRSLPHLVATLDALQQCGIAFRSLTEAIDSSTAAGRMMRNLLAVLAQYERELTGERTRAMLQAKRRRGERIGRKPALDPIQRRHALELVAAGEAKNRVARILGVHRATIYRLLEEKRASATATGF